MGEPIARVKGYGAFGLQISVWPNDNGQCSFTINKSYKDKSSGEYKQTNTLFMSDLLALRELISDALKKANKYSDTKHRENKDQGQAPSSASEPEYTNLETVSFDDDDIPF